MKSNSQVVVISWFVPSKSILSAGVQALRDHLAVLSEEFDVSVLAPRSKVNVAAASSRWPTLMPHSPVLEHPVLTIVKRAFSALIAPSFGASFQLGLRCDRSARNLILEANIVEFQWTQSLALLRYVREKNPSARCVAIVHDVNWQRLARVRQSSSAVKQILLTVPHGWLSLMERHRLSKLDHIVTLNDKDAELIRRAHIRTPCTTIWPSVGESPPSDHAMPRLKRAPTVLFVGAFDRWENAEGAVWLIEQVWPMVRILAPDATLLIAGANPSRALLDWNGIDGVEISGTLDSLDSAYARADAVAVALFHGAGIKFKAVAAMLRRIPVISTSVGAEGISDINAFVRVTDSAAEFSEGIIAALHEPEARAAAVGAASAWVDPRFNTERRRDSLLGLYRQLALPSTAVADEG